ncbi:MAG TPA: hypothetical protein VKB93_27460 [Thermoanaerobaculia bacterium]|nr:hypothetical protein [Thermoanaerobaculia bacterium]
MTPLHKLLGKFHDRLAPLGVAFVGSRRFAVSFGIPPTAHAWILEQTKGFTQYHIEHTGVSVYVSSFGWGKFLIAQFAFQEQYPPPAREWTAFVHLASAVTRAMEETERDSGGEEAPVLRPAPKSPRTRVAHASLPEYGELI